MIVALYQSGLFHHTEQPSTLASTGSSVTAPDTKPTQPQAITDQPITPEQLAETPAQKVQAREFQQPKRINLLAPENGAHVLVASSDGWTETIDGNEETWEYAGGEAVYGFKDQRPATFDTFTILIPKTDTVNVKEFELLVGNDSPTGAFESIGKFQTQNVKLFKTPYQEFKFPVVTAKYLKVKTLASYGSVAPGVYEFQLFGSLNYYRTKFSTRSLNSKYVFNMNGHSHKDERGLWPSLWFS